MKNVVEHTCTLERVNSNVIKIKINNDYAITHVDEFYRPFKLPNESNHLVNFRKQIKEIADFIDTTKSCVIVGDFNHDYEKLNQQNYVH